MIALLAVPAAVSAVRDAAGFGTTKGNGTFSHFEIVAGGGIIVPLVLRINHRNKIGASASWACPLFPLHNT
jgi:hypothetical protein